MKITRMMVALLALSPFFGVATAAEPLAWTNLDASKHVAGMQVSAGFLLGKVVFVDCRDYGAPGAESAIGSMERLWTTYRSRPFVLLGSHRGNNNLAAAKRNLEKAGATFPVYDDAGVPLKFDKHEKGVEFIFIIGADGKVRSTNRDEHTATMALTTWLTNAASPSKALLKPLLEFESENLPGRAHLRLSELRKSDPYEVANVYADMWKKLDRDDTVVALSKLEKLADQARQPAYGKKLSKNKIDRVIAFYTPFKKNPNPVVVQEAKNCLAELIWAKTALEAEEAE